MPIRCVGERWPSPTSVRAATRASSRRGRSRPTVSRSRHGFASRSSSPDFLDKNFLSDDRRYPVYQLGTNIARAAGTNAMKGQVWSRVFVGDVQTTAGDRKNQRALQSAGSREAARVGAQGWRPRLLSHADARVDVGDGSVSPQQRARDVREGSNGTAAGCSHSTTRPRSCSGPNDGWACNRSS